jgi:LuxR family maltose regulon positive regulatory protein
MHLVERLNAGLPGSSANSSKDRFARKLTLISAPAGFGKTTLVTEWIASRGEGITSLPFTWLSLDENDDDPTRFFTYILAALQSVNPDIGRAAQTVLQTPQSPPMELLLTTLVNDIASTFVPFVLVLDDYHFINAPAIHQQLDFLLEHQPSQMHLVIVTRADPPLALSRLRARGQMVEIRADDLRFTPDEVAVFLNQTMGLDLSAKDAAALESRTEGWIVGLQMAALSLQNLDDAAGFIQTFSGSDHFVLDYLMDEVLGRQPEAVYKFLLHTSILERMTGPLCDAVCAVETDATGQATMEMLHRANLFVVPLDTERRWYRYHHLFADLLRARLRQSQPDLVNILNARASRWCEAHDLASEAIHYALAAQDFDRAASLIEQNAMSAYQRGEVTTMFKWIYALPDPVARRHPGVCIWHGWLLVSTGQLENVEPVLKDVERHIRPNDRSPQTQSWRGGVAIVRAIAASRKGNVPDTIQEALLALEHLPQDNPFDRAHRVTAGYLLGQGYVHRGDLTKAEQTFAETVELARAAQIPFSTAMSLSALAKLCIVRGRLHRAADLYRECRRLAITPEGHPLPWMSIAQVGLGRLLCEWNELDQALHLLTEGIHDGERWGSLDTLVSGYTALMDVLQAQGDVDGARDALQKATCALEEKQFAPDIRRKWEARQVRWWLSQGDVSAARRWVSKRRLVPEDAPSLERELAYISLARVLIAQRDLDAALDLLARLADAAEARERTGRLIEILILQAVAFHARDETSKALVALTKSLTLAGSEGYVRIFVDEGAPMAALLRQAADWDVTPGYVTKLLAAFGDFAGTNASPVETRSRPQDLIEPLTGRELELLQLVADGLSNREIAARLFIALGTVKSHVHNIYGKLDAQNRAQAVARAKELGLI